LKGIFEAGEQDMSSLSLLYVSPALWSQSICWLLLACWYMFSFYST